MNANAIIYYITALRRLTLRRGSSKHNRIIALIVLTLTVATGAVTIHV
ncbi:phage holin family protein [Enterobacter asburiae]|nr:phage holin family protein [Enterobacter asburiae]